MHRSRPSCATWPRTSIAGSNAVVVNLLFGGLLLAWADHAARAGWGLFS
ncbi:MAG: hypothetical protein ACOYXR_00155 [Nitrospirota bacterium]